MNLKLSFFIVFALLIVTFVAFIFSTNKIHFYH